MKVDWQKVGALAWRVAANKNAGAAKAQVRAGHVVQQRQPAAASASAWDWDCVARAETGGNWSMHGGTYSSPFGVLNQAVRERAQPDPSRHHPDGTPYSAADVANAILSGTATREENIAMGNAEVARFGVRAWAPSTVRKCA